MAVEIPSATVGTSEFDGINYTNTNGCLGCTACPFEFNESGANPNATGLFLAYRRDVVGLCKPNTTLSIAWDGFGTFGNRFMLLADNATIYDTGCTTGSGSANPIVPAGTVQFTALVYGGCDVVGSDLWSFSASC